MIKNKGKKYTKQIDGSIKDCQEQDYSIICDYCKKEIPHFNSFIDAVNYGRHHNWKCIAKDGKWTDMCQMCSEKGVDRIE